MKAILWTYQCVSCQHEQESLQDEYAREIRLDCPVCKLTTCHVRRLGGHFGNALEVKAKRESGR